MNVETNVSIEQVVTPGSHVSDPFRIVFIANPFLKENGHIKRDPILISPDIFRNRVAFAIDDLFDREPTEFFSEPVIRNAIRVSTIFDTNHLNQKVRDADESHVLCMRHRIGSKYKIEASRRRVHAYLAEHGTWADVAILFSRARSSIPTAWFGTDNCARGGVPFTFDGNNYLHAFYSSLQGVAAFSVRPLRPFEFRHEFLHASSSINNGQILDEYDLTTPYTEEGVSNPFAINKKLGPNGDNFATYQGKQYQGMVLGTGSRRRIVPKTPGSNNCIMDRLTGTPQFDILIRDFMRDRFIARLNRQF